MSAIAPGAKHTLLIVDDDAACRLTLVALLEDAGFVVEAAASLAEARARLEQPLALSAVLLDLRLPDGSGLDLAPLVRARMPAARIVVVSGSGRVTSGRHAALCDAHCEKGLPFPMLLEQLRALLDACS